MEESDRVSLVEAWIAYWQAADESAARNALSWASDRLYDVSHESPRLCLQLCEEILARTSDEDVLAVLAAGPPEDVLAEHGPTIIDELERIASGDPMFRRLLGGVWEDGMPSDVCERIRKARESA